MPTDLRVPGSSKLLVGGGDHVLAVTADGAVRAWGKNDSGQCNVPAELNRVVKVAAGYWHTLALRNDGTIVAWGRNDQGQATVPPMITRVNDISASGNASFAAGGTLPACTGDVNRDGIRNGIDLAYVLSGWGPCP